MFVYDNEAGYGFCDWCPNKHSSNEEVFICGNDECSILFCMKCLDNNRCPFCECTKIFKSTYVANGKYQGKEIVDKILDNLIDLTMDDDSDKRTEVIDLTLDDSDDDTIPLQQSKTVTKRLYLEDSFPEMKQGGGTDVDSDHESDEDYVPKAKKVRVEEASLDVENDDELIEV